MFALLLSYIRTLLVIQYTVIAVKLVDCVVNCCRNAVLLKVTQRMLLAKIRKVRSKNYIYITSVQCLQLPWHKIVNIANFCHDPRAKMQKANKNLTQSFYDGCLGGKKSQILLKPIAQAGGPSNFIIIWWRFVGFASLNW